MQIFGNEESAEKNNKVVVGNHEVKIVKASTLSEGIHPVRFYPLSPEFYQGADYISIVQHLHWLSRQPCVCRRTSYDYSVPDTQKKPFIDVSCVICNDAFAWYKKAKSLKETDPTEAERLRQIGHDLREKVTASSIVSLQDPNGNLSFPIILRYGKELLDQLELHASRIFEKSGVHICDPAKGYMFEIIIGKNDGGFRTYKNSMPSEDRSPVDMTQAPWQWADICAAIRLEIKHVPSPEEVENFYKTNYGGTSEQQTFYHPAFQNNGQPSNGNVNSAPSFVPPVDAQTNTVPTFTPPVETPNNTVPVFTPPVDAQTNTVPTFTPPVETQRSPVPAFTPPVETKKKVLPCHAMQPNGSGYEQGDANCRVCVDAKSCYENSAPFKTENAKASNVPTKPVGFNPGDIKSELAELSKKMQSNA